MAKKYEGDIVGWFYRNGHRIPIRGKSNKPDTYDVVPDKKPGRIINSPEGQSEATAKSRASVEEMRDWDLFGERGSYTTRKRPKPVITNREPDRDTLRKNVKNRRAKEEVKLKGSQEYSKKEWDSFTNKKKLSIIEKESKRNKKKSIRDLERREPE